MYDYTIVDYATEYETERYGVMPGQYFPLMPNPAGTLKIGSDDYSEDTFYIAPAAAVPTFVSGNRPRDFFNDYLQMHIDENHAIGDNIVIRLNSTYANPSTEDGEAPLVRFTFIVGTGIQS